ncbi:MAG: nitroreductase family protein [Planctomycetota bacterium]
MDPILARRSIRAYTDEDVDDEAVRRLLAAAMAAPSAGNEQPWHFVVVRDAALRERIAGVHPYAAMVPAAPVAIGVCWDTTLEKHAGFGVQDCAAATENILIEAVQLGLGAVWLGIHPVAERVDAVRRLFGLPETVIPLALVAVGHPAEDKPPAERFDETRIHRDRW